MLQGVYEVDERLTEASNTLNEGDTATATRAIEVAVAMTRFSLRHVLQTLRGWESLSHTGVKEATTMFDVDDALLSARQQIAPTNAARQNSGTENG